MATVVMVSVVMETCGAAEMQLVVEKCEENYLFYSGIFLCLFH